MKSASKKQNGFTPRKATPRGFTLIELLVVIAIIGLLSTLAIIALGSARQKSRDARRLADIKQIQTAIEMYNNENGSYPTTGSSTIILGDTDHACLGSNGFQTAGACENQYILIPKDPSGNGYYIYSGTGTDYSVSATLEGTVNDLSGVVSVQPNTGLVDGDYGLVLFLKFDEGTGSTVADSSGNGNTGSWSGTGPRWGTRAGGGAGVFNGSDDQISISNSPSITLTNSVSLSFWFERTANWSEAFSYRGLVLKPYYMGFGTLIEWYTDNPTNWNITSGGVRSTVTGPTTTINTWYHSVGTYDYATGEMKYYIDGQLVGSRNIGSRKTIDLSTSSVRIGYGPSSNSPYFPGLIDDIRIYNRALSAAEVTAIYNAEK